MSNCEYDDIDNRLSKLEERDKNMGQDLSRLTIDKDRISNSFSQMCYEVHCLGEWIGMNGKMADSGVIRNVLRKAVS